MTLPTDPDQSPRAGTVRLMRNRAEDIEFTVHLGLGEWWCERVVTVTDKTIDVGDLLRRIARRETGVTQVDQPTGQIIYKRKRGVRRIVGEWYTAAGLSEYEDGGTDFLLLLPSPEGKYHEVEEAQVATLRVEVTAFVDNGRDP